MTAVLETLLSAIVSPVMMGGIAVGGIIVLAFLWGKIRPVIVVESKDGGRFFFGVSHSKKRKNMHPLSQDGTKGVEVDEDTCFGLSNTPNKIIKEIGTISEEKAQELLNSVKDKKVKKIEKRGKGTKN
jgi:hypothetical protein